jgi:hypothetical protein
MAFSIVEFDILLSLEWFGGNRYDNIILRKIPISFQ